MITRLKQRLDRLPVGTAADRTDLIGARGLLSEYPLYLQAVEQLSSSSVEVSPKYECGVTVLAQQCGHRAEHCRVSSTDKSSTQWQRHARTSTEPDTVAGMYQRRNKSPLFQSRRQQEPPSWMLQAGSTQLLRCALHPLFTVPHTCSRSSIALCNRSYRRQLCNQSIHLLW
jgi:hypothetical protein